MSGIPAVIGSQEPWGGGHVSPGVECILAPNPSPMTLDGTNTWLLMSADRAIVVDPGPDDPKHLSAITAALHDRDIRPEVILLTHGHADHSAGAANLANSLETPVRALDPQHQLGTEGLAEGDELVVGDIELRVIETPGHTADSLSFHLPGSEAILTGDTVLGRGTSVIAWPDGSLSDYLRSLEKLRRLAEEVELHVVLPGHGPAVTEPGQLLADYLLHREERLNQVRAAVAEGAASVAEIVEVVYQPLPAELVPAAQASTAAQWDHLAKLGEVPPRGVILPDD